MVSEYIPFTEDWPHQTFAVQEAIRMMNEGERAICITSSTGGGKSRIVQRLCEHAVNDGLTCVVMSNRILLTTQLLRALEKTGIDVGCRAAGFEAYTKPGAPIQVVSAPTEISRVLKRRKTSFREINLHKADIVFVDEAHLQSGDKTKEILDEYKQKHGATIFGITATPLGIAHVYDHLIVAGNNTQLRACGALVAAKCFEPAVVDLPKVRKSKTGLFSQEEMERDVRSIWSQHVVGHIFTHWKNLNPDGRPSLGMAPGVKESHGLAQEYWKRGVNAAHIDAGGIFVNGEYKKTNDQADRDELFEMARDGLVQQIWNRFVLREAIDLPWLYMLSIATPIASLLSYVQVVGRILRAHPSKDGALIADHCGAIRMHGSPNVDRDKDWQQYFHELDASKITKDRHEILTSPSKKEPEPITCPECKMIRKQGAKCPNCGHEHPKSVRMVIQENGTLKPSTGDVYRKRRVSQRPDTERKWLQCFHRMRNAKTPKTFTQVRALFVHENHYYPPDNLPMMPIKSGDWHKRIMHVDKADLYQRTENAPRQDRALFAR